MGTGVGTKHAKMYQTLPDLYEVTAVCEIDEHRRNEFVEQIGVGYQTKFMICSAKYWETPFRYLLKLQIV